MFLLGENNGVILYLEIHADSGTESQDWAEILRRIYING